MQSKLIWDLHNTVVSDSPCIYIFSTYSVIEWAHQLASLCEKGTLTYLIQNNLLTLTYLTPNTLICFLLNIPYTTYLNYSTLLILHPILNLPHTQNCTYNSRQEIGSFTYKSLLLKLEASNTQESNAQYMSHFILSMMTVNTQQSGGRRTCADVCIK